MLYIVETSTGSSLASTASRPATLAALVLLLFPAAAALQAAEPAASASNVVHDVVPAANLAGDYTADGRSTVQELWRRFET